MVEASVQTRIMLDARTLVERATRWLLRYRRPPLDIGATISHFSEARSSPNASPRSCSTATAKR